MKLAEMPVGGDILGHIDKNNQIIRYDCKENDFVKADLNKSIRTLFKPMEGIKYYIKQRKADIHHGGTG